VPRAVALTVARSTVKKREREREREGEIERGNEASLVAGQVAATVFFPSSCFSCCFFGHAANFFHVAVVKDEAEIGKEIGGKMELRL